MGNNETLDNLTRQFRDTYDAMAQNCASAEETGRWDTEQNGSMEGFAFAALSGAVALGDEGLCLSVGDYARELLHMPM